MKASHLVLIALAGGAVPTVSCDPPVEPPQDLTAVEPLTPDLGFSFHIPPFQVPGGTETQDCYFVSVPDINDGEDIWIDHFKIGQTPGSHHMNVFRVNSIVHLSGAPGDVVRGGECRISTNWSDWPLVANSQESGTDKPIVDWVLPEGVAQRFEPGELLMLQTHYVNGNIQQTPRGGEVRINFYKSPLSSPIEMGTLFATQQSIRICQAPGATQPTQVYSGSCSFPPGQEIHIAAANGHFHSRGTQFDILTWDGQRIDHPPAADLFYRSTDWNEPVMAIGLDAVVPAGGGVWWDCSYQWREPSAGCDVINERDSQQQGDCCYTFGNSAESAEHCNVFVYYWPKVESSVFCN